MLSHPTVSPRKRAARDLRAAIATSNDPIIKVHVGGRTREDINRNQLDEAVLELGAAVKKWAPLDSGVDQLAKRLLDLGDDWPTEEPSRQERITEREEQIARFLAASRVLSDQYESRSFGSITATLAALRFYRHQSGGVLKIFGAGGLGGGVIVYVLAHVSKLL